MMTKKAIMALIDIAHGDAHRVTRQMMDRLNAAKLVDFDPRRDGWHLTESGYDMMIDATNDN